MKYFRLFGLMTITFMAFIFINCNSSSTSKKEVLSLDSLKILIDKHKFYPNKTTYSDEAKTEWDTISGYTKTYYKQNRIMCEGKISIRPQGKFRDSVWIYYSETGLIMKVETYNKDGKVNSRNFTYYNNNKLMSDTYQYFEGDYKNKSTFRFHQLERLYDYNGNLVSEEDKVQNTTEGIK